MAQPWHATGRDQNHLQACQLAFISPNVCHLYDLLVILCVQGRQSFLVCSSSYPKVEPIIAQVSHIPVTPFSLCKRFLGSLPTSRQMGGLYQACFISFEYHLHLMPGSLVVADMQKNPLKTRLAVRQTQNPCHSLDVPC